MLILCISQIMLLAECIVNADNMYIANNIVNEYIVDAENMFIAKNITKECILNVENM